MVATAAWKGNGTSMQKSMRNNAAALTMRKEGAGQPSLLPAPPAYTLVYLSAKHTLLKHALQVVTTADLQKASLEEGITGARAW
eukprot:CAMPEP_0202356736 /NCGR_PEP_ID=MMETSP1126-20121109/11064_1 /ASSEMBLY_ACC=CAM_ASM_000457 /TAXON_ID=3047 /ORGANISM="Dunaliella tertiolecta, Strain CCMP1320" /LENGTH=83 /DNA_ID=CAMNT_0048949517 /DNA_START=173 /DNA_END=423 /DNA_ORIENTATION=+